jgi:type IV pilus assembly protein PilV
MSPARQRGVSLIEVLVALLVVSLGVLAVTGLQATAARYGKTSEFRAMATLLASDLADRMRANKPAVDAGSYTLTSDFAPIDDVPEIPTCAIATACTEAELAAIDIAEWKRALFSGLPSPDGYVVTEVIGAKVVAADVWVAWLDPSASSNETKADSDDDENKKECPPGFRDLDPQPRCLYVRVGF